jgi:cytochrome P450
MQEMITSLAVLLARYRFVATAPERVTPTALLSLKLDGGLEMRAVPR